MDCENSISNNLQADTSHLCPLKAVSTTSKRPRSFNETFVCGTTTPEMFKCKICYFTTNFEVDLTEHCRVSHEGKEVNDELERILKCYSCGNCGFETYSLLILAEHVYKGGTKAQKTSKLQCEQCCFESQHQNRLNEHILSQHGKLEHAKWFNCDKCQYKTKNRARLKLHINKHGENGLRFKCERCSYETEKKADLEMHSLSKKHDLVPEVTESGVNGILNVSARKYTKCYKCEKCSFKTTNKARLKSHNDKHAKNLLWFQCEHCSYESKSKAELEAHNLSRDHEFAAEMTDSSIKRILNVDFKILPLAQKIKIKTQGRHTPILNLHQEDKIGARPFTRHFSKDIYKKFKWMCGCDTSNALFCFPCVLFNSSGMDKTWSVTGFRDLKHLKQRARKHEVTVHHVNCCVELALVGSTSVAAQLNSVHRENIAKHNEEVTKNRFILKRMIDCIRFCGMSDLVLRGNDEQEADFRELIDFSLEFDAVLKEHLSNATVFKDAAKTIQNEILDSMLAVCRREVKEQVNKSEFLAMQCDEMADISNQCQMVMIIRYVYNGNIYEIFWTFLRVVGESAAGLTQQIENELDTFISNSPSKLISQTYDGDVTGGVQTKIKQKYRNAHLVHCYAHELNLIIQKATSRHSRVRTFFSYLSAIPNFFTSSTHRCNILEEIINRKLPEVTSWGYTIHTVNRVFENREKLIECFRELEEKCNKSVTCKEAYDLRGTLEDPDFIFWLDLFHRIFPHAAKLFDQFQATNKESAEFQKNLEEFEKEMLSIKNAIDEIERATYTRKISPESRNSAVAKSVCDTIILQLKERLSFRGHLEAASLLNVINLLRYSRRFPISTLGSVIRFYPMLQLDKVRTELEVIYSRKDFLKLVGSLNMLSWLSINGLNETFSETVKILNIILTTPMATIESERCFSTLTKVKTFLKNTVKKECLDSLNALAMISVNKNFMQDISNFDEKVIEHFVSRNDRRSDFVYKQ